MKKQMITALLTSTLAFNLFMTNVHAESTPITEVQDMTVTVNGEQVNFDVFPIMKSDRTLVPLRVIFEAIGATVEWDGPNQSIYATKNGKSIKLTIDSDIAFINEVEQTKIDVPATLYKDRTLVPLRFVGEAFAGEVAWDQQTKNVDITFPDVVAPPKEATIYVNDKKLDLGTFEPIKTNHTAYIPLAAILDNLAIDMHSERTENSYQLVIDGLPILFYIGENTVIVDGERITLSEPLIEENGVVLAPITIAKILGGTYQYIYEKNEYYIYINRVKFKHQFLEKESNLLYQKPIYVETVNLVGNRRLMLSDNPENLNERTLPEDHATLWHDVVQANEEQVDHRVYGWHINEFPEKIMLGITVENLSTTNEIEIVNLAGINRQTSNSWVNYDVGLPLAENALSGKLTSVNIGSSVKAGDTLLLKEFEVGNGFTIGFHYDFTVRKKSGTGDLQYKIRTVASKNDTDLTTILTEPVEIDQTALHPRGVWSSSVLETELPPYKVESNPIAYQISNGKTDHVMTVENGIGDKTQMVKNNGHYGASYKVKIPITNETGEAKTVRVRAGARGGIYNGAVKMKGKVSLIPTLKPMDEVVNIVDYVVENETDLIELEFMHAGGAALPLAIELITLE